MRPWSTTRAQRGSFRECESPLGKAAAEAFARLVDATYERRRPDPAGFDTIMPKTVATAGRGVIRRPSGRSAFRGQGNELSDYRGVGRSVKAVTTGAAHHPRQVGSATRRLVGGSSAV